MSYIHECIMQTDTIVTLFEYQINYSNLLWLGFELFVNLFQAFIITWYAFGSLKFKYSKKAKIFSYLGTILAMFSLITVTSYLVNFEGFGTFIHALLLFICIFFVTEGSLFNKIFVSLVPTNAIAASSTFVYPLFSYISLKTLDTSLFSESSLRVISLVLANFFYICILYIVKKITLRRSFKLKESEWFMLSLNITMSIIAYIFLYYSVYYSASPLANFYVALCSVAVITINITMYIVLSNFSNRYETEMENTLLRQQAEYQAGAIMETKNQYDELQKVRHDFNNTVRVIGTLSSEGKNSEIEAYIQEYFKTQAISKTMIKTGNSFVDAIVNSKLSEAIQLGIDVSISTISDLKSEHNIDLCSLLGNLLDNAIRASKESSKKVIKLDIRRDMESIAITVKNTIDSSVLAKNPDLVSDKQDKKNHGYGTKIIREIAKKHSGFADFYEEDGYFCCNVILYI